MVKRSSSIQIMYQTLAEAQWRRHSFFWVSGAVVESLPKLLRLPIPLLSLQQHVLSDTLYLPNYLFLPSGHLVFSCLGRKEKLIHFINHPYDRLKKVHFRTSYHIKAKRVIWKKHLCNSSINNVSTNSCCKQHHTTTLYLPALLRRVQLMGM